MSGEILATVKVKHADGYAVINESDFIEGEHEMYVEQSETAEPQKPSKTKKSETASVGVPNTTLEPQK